MNDDLAGLHPIAAILIPILISGVFLLLALIIVSV
jgi:hypothetical protein